MTPTIGTIDTIILTDCITCIDYRRLRVVGVVAMVLITADLRVVPIVGVVLIMTISDCRHLRVRL